MITNPRPEDSSSPIYDRSCRVCASTWRAPVDACPNPTCASNTAIRAFVPSDLDPSDFYDEYFEWIMKNYDGGYKDLYIGLYEDGWRFDDFIEEKHPELMVAEDPAA